MSTQAIMTSPEPPIILHADPEHTGLRIVIPFILFISFWISYFVLSAVLRSAYPALNSAVILSCLGALPLSLLAAGASEMALKRVWRSGRRLRIERDRVLFQAPDEPDVTFDLEQRMLHLWWSMPLKAFPRAGRERRIPARNLLVAGQLQQDERRLVVFTYAPPGLAERWGEQYPFQALDPAAVYDTSLRARIGHPSRPKLTPEVIAGRDGRYWLAERNRWQEGIELVPEDFDLLLQTIFSSHSG